MTTSTHSHSRTLGQSHTPPVTSTPDRSPVLLDSPRRPEQPVPGLVGRLESEWLDTIARHDGLATEWADHSPVLEGCHTLDQVVERCRDHDAALAAVLVRAQRGCPVAGRCLLAVVVPQLARAASFDRRAPLDDYLGAFWPAAMSVDPTGVARVAQGRRLGQRLVDATRRTLVRERAGGLWVVASATVEQVASHRADSLPPPSGPASEALPLIRAAVDAHLLTQDTGAVVASVYSEGLTGEQAARRHGTSPAAIRTRCSAAVRVLRAHRDALRDAATA